MSYRFSPSALAFYETAIHGDAIPEDAVYVAPARHAELLAAQAAGASIAAAPETGNPVIVPAPQLTAEQLQQAIGVAIKEEAARRMGPTRDIWAALDALHKLVAAQTPLPQAVADRFSEVGQLAIVEQELVEELESTTDPATFDYRSDNRWETESV